LTGVGILLEFRLQLYGNKNEFQLPCNVGFVLIFFYMNED